MDKKRIIDVFVFGLFAISSFAVWNRGWSAEKIEPQTTVKTVLPSVASEDSLGPNLLGESFGRYRDGFVSDGEAFVCDNGDNGAAHRGVARGVTLHQEIPKPIFASAESKAEGVVGAVNSDYAIYIDLVYEDGTTLWGQAKPFSIGSHDWEKKEFFVVPAKPVKSLTFYTLFRNHRGKASFRNLSLRELKVDSSALLFDALPLTDRTPLPEDRVSLQIRDVRNDSGFVFLGDETDFGEKPMTAMEVEVRGEANKRADGTVFYSVLGKNRSKEDRVLTLLVSLPLPKEGVVWLESGVGAKGSAVVEKGKEYFSGAVVPVGANGRLSRWPFGAITLGSGEKTRGVFLGIDPDFPAFYRVFYNEPTGELALAFDLALTPEQSEASLKFVRAPFRPEDGFGGAMEVYRDLYPDAFVCRAASQGNWMPFAPISEIPDGRFRF